MYASNDTYQPIPYVPDLNWTCILVQRKSIDAADVRKPAVNS